MIAALLGSADVEAVVFGPVPADPVPHDVAVPHVRRRRAPPAERLAGATYVDEWIGPRQRVPVFAVDPLRQLLADPLRRFFFVELLASYTHVVSGSTWVATRRGWRRRRFSELDPVQLAGLLDTVPAAERPGVLRRLGDLALFLTGVFPDHTASTPLGRPLAEAQLLRSAGVEAAANAGPGRSTPSSCSSGSAPVGTGSPPSLSPAPSGSVEVLAAIADQFTDARRILNVVTDTYLFPLRERWFGRP